MPPFMARFWQLVQASLGSLGKLGLGAILFFFLLVTIAALRGCGLNAGI